MKSKSNPKGQPLFDVSGSKPTDWIDKQQMMQTFPISSRTLQYYRSKQLIPFSKVGGKILYHLPGFLRVLERNASRSGTSHLFSLFFCFLFSGGDSI